MSLFGSLMGDFTGAAQSTGILPNVPQEMRELESWKKGIIDATLTLQSDQQHIIPHLADVTQKAKIIAAIAYGDKAMPVINRAMQLNAGLTSGGTPSLSAVGTYSAMFNAAKTWHASAMKQLRLAHEDVSVAYQNQASGTEPGVTSYLAAPFQAIGQLPSAIGADVNAAVNKGEQALNSVKSILPWAVGGAALIGIYLLVKK